tara:strand:- start:42 stop:1340 length:1299 start_codon:yes stop_codon:yes gene_type:complete
MKGFEKIRYISFWFLDTIKGSKIKKHYKDISFILDNYSNPVVQSKLNGYIDNLLKHAIKTTMFYKKQSKYTSLSDFPIINKNTIRDRFNEFESEVYLNRKNKHISTSGSTGTPLTIFQNGNKVRRNTGDTIYFSEQANFKIGYKLLYLRLWDGQHKKSSMSKWLQNICSLDVLDLNDIFISRFLEKIKKDSSNKGWIGYASGYERICKYLDKINATPINANIKSIIAISEGLNDYTKQSMAKYFNAPIVSRYSNMENGIIAQQNPNGTKAFKINWASYHIEILKLNMDVPTKPGEIGRIVITDLFNYCMPMIRYDTGDLGEIDYNQSPPVFKKIEGRKTDIILNTKGEIVSSFILFEIATNPNLLQVQFIQKTQYEYTLKLNITDRFDSEIEILDKLKNYLGDDAKINIEYVNDIPLLASGKRKVTLNNYLN